MEKLVLKPGVQYIKPIKALMYGPQWAGKTFNALTLAIGFVLEKHGYKKNEDALKHILLVGTENRRATMYIKEFGAFNYHEIKPPFNPQKIIDIQNQVDTMDDVDVVIYDSWTHFWSKQGGVLDLKAKKDQQGGNSFTNWQEFSALFNRMVDTALQSPKDVIVTCRSKNDTVIDTSSGKAVPKTYGLKPDLREGIEYDFDIVFAVEKETHNLLVDKGVLGMDPVYPVPTVQTGTKIYNLFNSGSVKHVRNRQEIEESIRLLTRQNSMVQFVQLWLSGRKLDEVSDEDMLTLEKDLIKEIKLKQNKR